MDTPHRLFQLARISAFILVTAAVLVACATVPLTGRRQLSLIPASSMRSDMSSTAWRVLTIARRCSGRVGAIENPQFPAMTDVTPGQHDDDSAGSQNTCAS